MAVTLHNGDCMEYMRGMPDSSVDLIATDPPYFRVKNEPWDRQWDTGAGFIAWLGDVLVQFERILKPNGSLYLFASPQMAARVECAIGERFNVLNQIVWRKEQGRHNASCKESLRCYFPQTERIIFAEHYGADNIAKGEAGYAAKCDKLRGFIFEPLRLYLERERVRAGLKREDVRLYFAEKLGTKGKISGHYYDVSQWDLPTKVHYEWLRDCHNKTGGEYLKREYEELRAEYEELRAEYEELRRPFSVSADVAFTDVWTFPTVQAHKGKHPCAKPVEMMCHIIQSSSREGAVVFDPFMGGGSTGVAAQMLGRDFIGCEMNAEYFATTKERLSQRDLLAA